MGRRGEPELDELSKLLRRLETMEVCAQAGERAQSPSPMLRSRRPNMSAPCAALRPPKFPMTGADHAHDKACASGARRAVVEPTGTRSSSSTSAIVIGATTAAVVSSVVVAGLVLWINGSGGQKSEGERRLTFYAPAEPSRVSHETRRQAPLPRRSGPVRIRPPTNAQALLQRADFYLRSGKPGEARIVLEQAAQLGSGVAALTLGAMYDPGRATQFSNLELKADPTWHVSWYERAKDLGVAEANDRLAELAAR